MTTAVHHSLHRKAVYALLYLPSLSQTPSSSHLDMSLPETSSANFQYIFDAALSDYAKQTKIDLATHPSAQSLQNCNSADAVFDLLQDRAKQFQDYRDGNRKLIDCLKPVVQVLHSVSGILGEVAAVVSGCGSSCLIRSHTYTSVSRFHSNLQRQFSLASMSSSRCVFSLPSSTTSL